MSQPQTYDDWRVRLAQKIEESGKSMRAISLACGRAAGYVHSILKDRKNPRAETLAEICAEAGTSVSYVLYGIDISAEEEVAVSLFSLAASDVRAAILTLLLATTGAK
ncbi:XRE family transcriptional regulator [Bartonella apis]|uniref:XRE family transcriptional regulator n=1 Tax=Bartonella apis TaxID=1686310 RepID=UPI001FEDA0E8|nr:XRE family transcriptional regulator [Bartonella apis]